jgi:hypothetical protein
MVVAFPLWRAISRDEGSAPGDPEVLIEPGGRRHAVLQILRRRLVASCDPHAPIRHEAEVRTAAGDFLLVWSEPDAEWRVAPL